MRMVYDGTASVLNDFIWAPWFPMPTSENIEDGVMPGYFFGDLDI